MKKYLFFIGLIFCMAFPGQSQDEVIDLTTGTDIVGNMDPIWQVRLPGATFFNPVPITTGVLESGSGTLYPNAYVHSTCGKWISPHVNAAFNIVASGTFTGIYTYRAVVNVDPPCGIASAELCFNFMAADNTLPAVRVNDDNYPPPPGITHVNAGNMCTAVSLTPGINVIEVDVNNWDAYTALHLCGELEIYYATCPPVDLGCCEAPAGQVLSWTEVDGAIGYDINFGFNDPNSECCPNSTELPTGWMEFINCNAFVVPESFADCFSWRVRAVFADGSKSEWSEEECDCTEDEILECETPTDLSCTINSVGRILSWSSVADASYYDVMINYNDPDCCPVGDDLPFSMIYETTDEFYIVPGFNKCYSWSVRTHCTNGGISDWSEFKCSNDCFFPISKPNQSNETEATSRSSLTYESISTSVVPNPANEFVTITISDKTNAHEVKNATLVLFDISGKEVYKSSISLNEAKKIDVSHFNSGIYLLRVLNNGKLVTSDKLVIQ